MCLSSLSLSSELDESDSELADPVTELPELSDSCSCCIIRRGIFFKYSRKFSVMPPSPMDVKKLIENRVFLGLSLGKIDSKESCIVGSLRRSYNATEIFSCNADEIIVTTGEGLEGVREI